MSVGLSHAFWAAPTRSRAVLGGAAALIELHQRVLPAGELCPESAALVAALLRHAAEPAAELRPDVLHLVAAVATAAAGAQRTVAGSTPGAVGSADCRKALHDGLPVLLALLDDTEPAVRIAAAGVLGELAWCAAEVVPQVRSRFAAERANDVRLALVLAVGHLLDGAAAAPAQPTPPGADPERRRALRWLSRRRGGDDPSLRLAAALLARRRGRAAAGDLPALLDGLAGVEPVPLPGVRLCDWVARELGEDREARIAVAVRLFEVRGGAGPDALRAAAAAICIWRSAAAPLLPVVAERLTDPDPAVRAAAAHLVAVAGAGEPDRYADRLATLLADPAARVADLAAWGLARMGDERCLPRLRNRALIGTSVFDVVQAHYPREVYLFTAPALFDVLAPLGGWAGALLPRVGSALSDADSYHQRRVLTAVLAAWGAAAAPSVPDLVPLLESDAAVHACAALGAVGPAAGSAGHRLFRLVERGTSSRLRLAAGWAHWRVTGDPETALRVLGAALDGELAVTVLGMLADLGPLAATHTHRVLALGAAARSDWVRVLAARCAWRLTGDPADAVEPVLPVLAPLAVGRTGPAVRPAAALAVEAAPADPRVVALLAPVATGDRRYAYYGDWRAVADDEELASVAAGVNTK
jgi:HEAT repeat